MFIFFDKCLFNLSVTQNVCCTLTVLLARRHQFKFHSKHFPRNTWCFSFDGHSNYLYLFKNHRQIFAWPGERRSSILKVAKRDLVQTLNIFPNPCLQILAEGRHLLFSLILISPSRIIYFQQFDFLEKI